MSNHDIDTEYCPDHGVQRVMERDTDSAMTVTGPRIFRYVALACGCTPAVDLGADRV